MVTLGERGAAIYTDGQRMYRSRGSAEQILDPTGVGDAFRGGFVRGERLGLDWETCGRMGALAATYCLETRGPQEHTYTRPSLLHVIASISTDDGALNVLIAS